MSDEKNVNQPSGDKPPQQSTTDPFSPENLKKLRMSQDFATMSDVKQVYTTIAVRKPKKHEFVRVLPGTEYRFETGCFVDKEKGECYLIDPAQWDMMRNDVTHTCLVVAIGRNSPIPFLWPLTIPDSERPNRWHETAIEAATLAESKWIRCVADIPAGQYVPFVAQADLPEPEWPESLTMSGYLRLAFKDRLIDSPDHPMLRALRGEI